MTDTLELRFRKRWGLKSGVARREADELRGLVTVLDGVARLSSLGSTERRCDIESGWDACGNCLGRPRVGVLTIGRSWDISDLGRVCARFSALDEEEDTEMG